MTKHRFVLVLAATAVLIGCSPVVRAADPEQSALVDSCGDPLPTKALRRLGSIRLRTGFDGSRLAMSFSPDGRLIATSGGQNSVDLWHISTGKRLRGLHGGYGTVDSLAFSPNGAQLATGGHVTTRVFDACTSKLLYEFQRDKDVRFPDHLVTAVAFAPDSKTLASSSWDGTVSLWNSVTGQKLGTFRAHQRPVNALAFSPDGKTLATGSNDTIIRLWDVATRNRVRQLVGHLVLK